MAFKQRVAQSNYNRLRSSAEEQRKYDAAALSGQAGGLQWHLGTQEYWHQDAANDAAKNDRLQIEDWIDAMGHHKKGVDQAYAATQSLIQSIPKVAGWIESERKASQTAAAEADIAKRRTDNAQTAKPPVKQKWNYQESLGLSKEASKKLESITPKPPDQDEIPVDKNRVEEYKSNKEDGIKEQIAEQKKKEIVTQISDQATDPVQGVETLLSLLNPDKGKYYNRRIIAEVVQNSDSIFNQWLSNADKDLKIIIKGGDGKDQEVSIQGFLENPIHETSTSPYKQVLNYWINNVLGPTALEAVGKDFFSKNIIPLLNKSYNTIVKDYEKNWVVNAHQNGLREAKTDYIDLIASIDQGDEAVELYKQITPMILRRITYHSKGLKMDGHKKDAINAFEQMIKTGALLNNSQLKSLGTEHVPDMLIPATDVPWVSKKDWIKGVDGINRVRLGVAYPDKFSEVAMQKVENDIISNKIQLDEQLDKNRATNAVEKHIETFTKLPADFPNRKEMEQNSIINIIAKYPNQTEITNKLLDTETLKKSARESLATLNGILNSISGTKLTAKDVATAHPQAIEQVIKQRGVKSITDPSIYETKPLMAQFSADQIKGVIALGEAGIDDNNKAWDIRTKDTGETQIIKNWVAENLVEKFIRAEVADLRQAAEATGGTFVLDERTLEKIATGAGTKLYERIIRDKDKVPPGMFTVDVQKGMSENFHKARGSVYGDYTQREIDANRGKIMERALREYGGLNRLSGHNSDIINKPLTNIDKTRFKLTPEGNLDSLWHQLERNKTINPDGKSALEIYKAWGPANGVDDLEDPVDWSESAKVLEKNNINIEKVKLNLNNPRSLERTMNDNPVGAVMTRTVADSIINTFGGWGSRNKYGISSIRGFTDRWDKQLIPEAMNIVTTNNLKTKAIIPIALALYLNKTELIDDGGKLLIYNDPEIKKLLSSLNNGGLD